MFNNPTSTNPFRVGLGSRTVPEPCSIVIFGASGDLTRRKLIPALYNLSASGNLPPGVRVIGFARRDKTTEQFRSEMEEATRTFSRRSVDDKLWANFASNVYYFRGDFHIRQSYIDLDRYLSELETSQGFPPRRLFYLSASPDEFPCILNNLRETGLNKIHESNWPRIVLEKPFGNDLASARKLNELVLEVFRESQTFRIDHYLGKETAQNILVLRFANKIFESVWNANYIDHVQISACESLGIGGRAGYYDKAGALRDMVQNHLLQFVCLTAMEPPSDLSPDSIRDEKVKVLRALRPIVGNDVALYTVRAQYTAGRVEGQPVFGYRQETGIPTDSSTETYTALRLDIDNWRWSGVPFFLRTGKRLPKNATEIAIHFKAVPPVLFRSSALDLEENVLVIRIQPDEGASLRIAVKRPGPTVTIEPVKMDFHYRTSFGSVSPDAYERLLLDVMANDSTLFARRDEVEEAWRFVDGIRNAWDQGICKLLFYSAGSWGPEEADRLIAKHGTFWRRL
ncbi:MAG: glucose-6-phosphate dehydrogenase [Chthoniobacterales bacterium]|nr:glucose-6-phosphate dehydrogenase [Chthoniobacterales bacterium]MCX7712963.1 glucose-6-phosphate dehydrogenase [Chthoniobacterales bacterium]